MHKTISAKTGGFTLLEMLVVVLIIGILTVIAVPQYELAVEKAAVGSILPILKGIDSAQQVYFFTNGVYAMDFDALDLSMPAGGTLTTSGTTVYMRYPKYSCLLRYGTIDSKNSYSAYCYTKRGTAIEKYYSRTYFTCWASKTDEKQQKICQTVANKTTLDGQNTGAYAYYF